MQRALGNAGVAQLAAAGGLPIQRAMEVGAANDPLEDEADRVAEQVMTMPAPGGVSGDDDEGVMMSRSPVKISRMEGAQDDDEMQLKRLQRKCAACEEESMQMMRVQRETAGDEEDVMMSRVQRESDEGEEDVMMSRVQREATGDEEDVMMSRCVSCGAAIQRDGGDGSGPVSSSVESSINSVRARGGAPLPESERAFFEPRFGYDFGGVRVHTGPEAQQISRSLNARAFTVGRDVFFGANEYAPGSSGGRRLMAHELTHTVQQGGSGVRKKPVVSISTEGQQREFAQRQKRKRSYEAGRVYYTKDGSQPTAQSHSAPVYFQNREWWARFLSQADTEKATLSLIAFMQMATYGKTRDVDGYRLLYIGSTPYGNDRKAFESQAAILIEVLLTSGSRIDLADRGVQQSMEPFSLPRLEMQSMPLYASVAPAFFEKFGAQAFSNLSDKRELAPTTESMKAFAGFALQMKGLDSLLGAAYSVALRGAAEWFHYLFTQKQADQTYFKGEDRIVNIATMISTLLTGVRDYQNMKTDTQIDGASTGVDTLTGILGVIPGGTPIAIILGGMKDISLNKLKEKLGKDHKDMSTVKVAYEESFRDVVKYQCRKHSDKIERPTDCAAIWQSFDLEVD